MLLRDTAIMITCLGAPFTAFFIDCQYYASISHEEFTMSIQTRVPWCCYSAVRKVEIGNTWSQGNNKSWAVCKRTF